MSISRYNIVEGKLVRNPVGVLIEFSDHAEQRKNAAEAFQRQLKAKDDELRSVNDARIVANKKISALSSENERLVAAVNRAKKTLAIALPDVSDSARQELLADIEQIKRKMAAMATGKTEPTDTHRSTK